MSDPYDGWGHAETYADRRQAIDAALRHRQSGKRVKIVHTSRGYEVKTSLPNDAERQHGSYYAGRRFRKGSRTTPSGTQSDDYRHYVSETNRGATTEQLYARAKHGDRGARKELQRRGWSTYSIDHPEER